jgi:hypothetical protein
MQTESKLLRKLDQRAKQDLAPDQNITVVLTEDLHLLSSISRKTQAQPSNDEFFIQAATDLALFRRCML